MTTRGLRSGRKRRRDRQDDREGGTDAERAFDFDPAAVEADPFLPSSPNTAHSYSGTPSLITIFNNRNIPLNTCIWF